MPTIVENVYTPGPDAVKGVIFRAKLGTTMPTDEKADPDAAFEDLGGVSDAGITNSMSREVQKIKDFGGKTIAVPQSDYTETMRITLVESLRLEALKAVFGEDAVTDTAATESEPRKIVVDHTATPQEKCSWIIDTVQGKGIRRQIIPIGQVTTVGDVVQVNNDVVKYELTIECFEYLDETANKSYFVREFVTDGRTKTKPTSPGGASPLTMTAGEFVAPVPVPDDAADAADIDG